MIKQLIGVMPPDPSLPAGFDTAFGNIKWYAIFIMIGFIVAIVASCLKMWKRYKISTEPFYWFILIGVPLAIIGANFGSCVLDNGLPSGQNPGKPWSEFFSSFGSGLAIEWGIIFVVIAGAIYFPLVLKLPRYRVKDEFKSDHQVKKISFWMYADAVIPCILIAQFIGRWGNYFNGEVFGGNITNEHFAWWLYHNLPNMYQDGNWKQPLFLWEGIGNAIMFFVLYFGVEFIKQRKAGDMAAGYFVWYGAFRLGLEPLRDKTYFSVVTIVVSSLFVAFGAIFILINHLILAKVRDKKIWHTLFKYGPKEVFTMINCGWHIEKNIRYKDRQYADCVRQPQEMIYFGAW